MIAQEYSVSLYFRLYFRFFVFVFSNFPSVPGYAVAVKLILLKVSTRK